MHHSISTDAVKVYYLKNILCNSQTEMTFGGERYVYWEDAHDGRGNLTLSEHCLPQNPF